MDVSLGGERHIPLLRRPLAHSVASNSMLQGGVSGLPLSAWAQQKAGLPSDGGPAYHVPAAGEGAPAWARDSGGTAFPDTVAADSLSPSPAKSTAGYERSQERGSPQAPSLASPRWASWRSADEAPAPGTGWQLQQQSRYAPQPPAVPPGMDAQAYMAGERAAFMHAYQQALPAQQALGQLSTAVDAVRGRLQEEAAHWRQVQLQTNRVSQTLEVGAGRGRGAGRQAGRLGWLPGV